MLHSALVVARSVPGICRIADEAALAEITQRRELQAGRSNGEAEDLFRGTRRLTQKAALALFGDAERGAEVLGRLNRISPRHADTVRARNRGAHGVLVTGDPRDTAYATRDLIDALRGAAA